MKWRRWLLVGGLIVVGVVVFGFVSNYRSEPHYKGRTLSAWLKIFSTTSDEDDRDEAIQAVRQIGTNAIPYLLTDLRSELTPWKVRVYRKIERWPGPAGSWWQIMMLHYRPPELAYEGFRVLGPLAAPAVPALIAELESTNANYLAHSALVAIGRPSIPFLTDVITNRSNSPGLRSAAAIVLREMGTDAGDAVWLLLQCLDDEDKVSESAISALSSIAAEPTTVVLALTNALVSPRVVLRQAAIQSLEHLAQRAPSLAPLMREALTDEDGSVRWFATNALNKFYPEEFPLR